MKGKYSPGIAEFNATMVMSGVSNQRHIASSLINDPLGFLSQLSESLGEDAVLVISHRGEQFVGLIRVCDFVI